MGVDQRRLTLAKALSKGSLLMLQWSIAKARGDHADYPE
jgi:hypothetical protein